MAEKPNLAWQLRFNQLWDELVPRSGQADTVQGELVRSIGRLTDEAYRNGNGNFDDGYHLMCQYLRDNLNDPTVFNKAEIDHINSCIDRVLDDEYPDVDRSDTCYDRLTEYVVRWCSVKKDLIPYRHNPRLHR